MEKGSPSREFSFTISLHPSSNDDHKSFADDIFFRGHLLPLSVSPRASATSLDSPPPKLQTQLPKEDDPWDCKIRRGSASFSIHRERTSASSKPKTSSIFGWRRSSDKDKTKRFDVAEFVKRYTKLVRPLFPFKGKAENGRFTRQPHSFSDSRSLHCRKQCRGDFNSGPLLPIPSSSSDSSMEELQAAIQAAIAHCKNSISEEEHSDIHL